MIRVNIHFEVRMLKRIAKAVLLTGMSKAEFVRRAVESALQKLKL
ncbi:MAG: ribbon-helix-helix protein, CopG family [Burkholderiales bacterium]